MGRAENLALKRKIEKEKISRLINDHKPWGHKVYAKLGAALLAKLIQAASVENPDSPGHWENAFSHSLRREMKSSINPRSLTVGYISLNEWVILSALKVPTRTPVSHASLNPMRVPPVDWTTPWNGGYLMLPTHLIRTRGNLQTKLLNEGHTEDQARIYDGVNAIQR